MAWLQELGNLYGSSIRFRDTFCAVAIASDGVTHGSVTAIKPLCPTRWLMRTPAILSVVNQYKTVLQSLEENRQLKKETRASTLAPICQ